MALTLPPAVSRTSKADGKACGQVKCLFFGLQQMGPDGFSQTPGDACTGARGAGTEVREGDATCAPSSAVPTPSRTSPLALSWGLDPPQLQSCLASSWGMVCFLPIIGYFIFRAVLRGIEKCTAAYTCQKSSTTFSHTGLLSCHPLTSITTVARAAAAHFCLEA